MPNRASGLGRACVVDICTKGGNVAILDLNVELATELVKEIGGGKTKYFECNVLQTESIAAAVKGSLEWAEETGKLVGGVLAAAGVSTPAKVSSPHIPITCLLFFRLLSVHASWASYCLSRDSVLTARNSCFLVEVSSK